MGKTPKQQTPQRAENPEDEAVIMERVKEGFKRLLNTPPETHEEMVRRRRAGGPKGKRKKSR